MTGRKNTTRSAMASTGTAPASTARQQVDSRPARCSDSHTTHATNQRIRSFCSFLFLFLSNVFFSSSYYSDIVQRMPIYSLYHLFLCIVLEFFSSFFTVDLCDSLQSELLIPIRVTKSGSFQCSHSTKELFSKKKETNEKLVLRDRFSVNEILIIKKLPKTSRFLI